MEGESDKQVTTKSKGLFSDNYINISGSNPYLSDGCPNKHGSSYPAHGHPQLPPPAFPAYGYPQPQHGPGYSSPPPAYTYSGQSIYGYAHGQGQGHGQEHGHEHGHGYGHGHGQGHAYGYGHGQGQGHGYGQQHQQGYYYQEFNSYNAYAPNKPAAGGIFGYRRHGCISREVPADATA